MWEAMGAGLSALLAFEVAFYLVVGIIYGIVIGILPGLGGIVAMALLLPFTWNMEFAAAMSLLLGAHIATIWGSSVTSILFRVPGAAKSVALIFNGFPMTQRGEANRALGASAMAALLGGVIGAVFLAAAIPITRPVMMALGPAEFLMLALWTRGCFSSADRPRSRACRISSTSTGLLSSPPKAPTRIFTQPW